MRWQAILVGLVLVTCVACSDDRSRLRPYLESANLDFAAKHLAAGEKEEAAQLYQAVLLADPTNEQARKALAEIGEYDRCIMMPSAMGRNYVCRPLRRSVILWVVMYPVDRVLDILDIFSVHVGLEGGAYVDAHVTHAMQLAAGGGGGVQVGWWQKRNLALGTGHVAGLAFGPVSVEGEGFTGIGTGGIGTHSFSVAGLSRPSDIEYQRYRDYWGIGARAVVGVVGAEVEIHPLEIVDAICGFFFIDFLRDDIGRTYGLNLTRAELNAMENLIDTMTPAEIRERIEGRLIAPPPIETPPANPAEPPKPAPAPSPTPPAK